MSISSKTMDTRYKEQYKDLIFHKADKALGYYIEGDYLMCVLSVTEAGGFICVEMSDDDFDYNVDNMTANYSELPLDSPAKCRVLKREFMTALTKLLNELD